MIKIEYKRIEFEEKEDVFIHPIGDLHIGHKNCDLEFIQNLLNEIPFNKNHRIILMGDLLDVGIKNSIGGSVYENDLTPQEQIDFIVNLLTPYKEQIDGYVMGNHEYRIYKDTGIDICKIICKQLGINYALYAGTVTYSMNHKAYNINYFHGRAGGSIENALKKCREMANKVDADIYLMGHVHKAAYTQREIKRIDSRNGKIVEGLQYFILTGHALSYDDSYAEQANLEISPKGYPIIELSDGRNKKVSIAINN